MAKKNNGEGRKEEVIPMGFTGGSIKITGF